MLGIGSVFCHSGIEELVSLAACLLVGRTMETGQLFDRFATPRRTLITQQLCSIT